MINNLYIKAGAALATGATAKLMKTGQTTSYRTGDDGDIEAGRATDFTTLAENNPFGNTDRFTDELGGQTYTNNIVIDWSTYDGATVLGWRRTTSGDVSWNDAVDQALATSIGTFTTGWRLPNVQELFSIVNCQVTNVFSYPPFNLSTVTYGYWTGTTGTVTTNAYRFANSQAFLASATKVTVISSRYFPCRVFTVTGTTLS